MKKTKSMYCKISDILILILIMAVLSTAKNNIAIIEFTGTLNKSEAGILTDKTLSLIANSGKYKIIERSMMAEILKEQQFQQTGCTSSECAVEVGQILGVENIVFGSVGKLGAIYSISLRLIDVATGEVIKTSTYELQGGIEDVLVKGIKNVVNDLLEDNNSAGTKEFKKQGNAQSSHNQYEKRIRTKRIWTIINTAGAVVSASATTYFLINMNNENKEYDNMTIASASNFDTKWGKVEDNRNYAIISGSSTACFATAAIILAIFKIETSNGNTISFKPAHFNSGTSLTVNFNF